MAGQRMGRKEFLAALGCAGAGACMCGAVLGMRAAWGDESPPAGESQQSGESETPSGTGSPASEETSTRPGEKSVARAAKRMEFVDGWVPRFFQVVDEELDEPTRRSLMVANGKACFCAYAPNMQRRAEPATPERIAQWVAQRGKESGYWMDGEAIVSEYLGSAETGQASPEGVCLCPTVEAQNAKSISPTYCWCSVGYVKEMHERIFGRPVTVELTHSVLKGDPRCRFRIALA
jgi:hypothetical protein